MDNLLQFRVKDIPLDEASYVFAKEILSQEGVKKMVILPDSFTKDKYLRAKNKVTIPSSVAIVSDMDHFYPLFRSRGINCGMTVLALPLHKQDLSDKFIKDLFAKINYSIFYYINYRLRLPFTKAKHDLSQKDFENILSQGAPYFAKKFSLEGLGLENIEFGGVFEKMNFSEIQKYLNKDWLYNRNIRLRNSFGRYFGGNHFLEIQEVVSSDNNLGLSKGQLVLMYHTAGESLEDVIDQDIRQKYIDQSEYKSISVNSEDFNYFSTALAVLMNFGFAYRLATAAIINDVLKNNFGDDKNVRIILDRSHNHFTKEKINDEEMMVYRHNAERLEVGKLAILSGHKNHNSYIIRGGESISKTFYTIDHGLGTIINNKKTMQKTGEKVDIHRFKKGLNLANFHSQKNIELMKNSLVEDYFSLMSKENIAHQVAELKPLVNIKST